MDVYVDKRDRVWLVDFNVYTPVTDALLFSWTDFLARDEMLTEEQEEEKELGDHPHMMLREGSMDVEVMEEEEEEQQQQQEMLDNEGAAAGGSSSRGGIRNFRVQAPGLVKPFIFRVIGGKNASVGPDPLASYRVPIDMSLGMIGGGSSGGAVEEGVVDMQEVMRRCMNNNNREREDDSDDDGEDDEETD